MRLMAVSEGGLWVPNNSFRTSQKSSKIHEMGEERWERPDC